eukprot:7752450-Pyramimonas_sp.AAC.1
MEPEIGSVPPRWSLKVPTAVPEPKFQGKEPAGPVTAPRRLPVWLLTAWESGTGVWAAEAVASLLSSTSYSYVRTCPHCTRRTCRWRRDAISSARGSAAPSLSSSRSVGWPPSAAPGGRWGRSSSTFGSGC